MGFISFKKVITSFIKSSDSSERQILLFVLFTSKVELFLFFLGEEELDNILVLEGDHGCKLLSTVALTFLFVRIVKFFRIVFKRKKISFASMINLFNDKSIESIDVCIVDMIS